jgi:uncharacterized paraquat-inducible protein A
MNPEEEQRKAAGNRITQNAGLFKICEGCDSILERKAAVCPVCQTYRFEYDEEMIKKHALLIAARPPVAVPWIKRN